MNKIVHHCFSHTLHSFALFCLIYVDFITGIDRLFIFQSFFAEFFSLLTLLALRKEFGFFRQSFFQRGIIDKKKRHPDEWIALCMILSNRISEQFLADDGGIHFRRNGDEGDFLA